MTGNVVVLGVVWGGGSTPNITVPAGYVAAGTQQFDGSQETSRLYYKFGGLSTTIAVSVDSGNRPVLMAAEYSFSGTAALDVVASSTDGSAGTSHTTDTVNPVDAAESLLIALFAGSAGGTSFSAEAFSGPSTGSDAELFDLDSGGAGSNDCRGVLVERIDTNTQAGNYSCSATSSGSVVASKHILVIRNVPPTTAYSHRAARFRLQVRNWSDRATRFRIQVQQVSDRSARFCLALMATGYSHRAVRFILSGQGFKDVASRFRVQVTSFKDVSTRFRLKVTAYRDIAARFRILAGTTYRDVAGRFRLQRGGFSDRAARLRLRATGWKDAALRFTVKVAAFADRAVRFRTNDMINVQWVSLGFTFDTTPTVTLGSTPVFDDVLYAVGIADQSISAAADWTLIDSGNQGSTFFAHAYKRVGQADTVSQAPFSLGAVGNGEFFIGEYHHVGALISHNAESFTLTNVANTSVNPPSTNHALAIATGAATSAVIYAARILRGPSPTFNAAPITVQFSNATTPTAVDVTIYDGIISPTESSLLAQATMTAPAAVTVGMVAVFGDQIQGKRDAGLRFVLTTSVFRNVATRFRLVRGAFNDRAARFRLRVTTFNDRALRFVLVRGAYSDVATRLRLRATTYRDLTSRFRLQVTNWSDRAARFVLKQPFYVDVVNRFRLRVTNWSDRATRFSVGPPGWSHVAARLRILASAWSDRAARFRLLVQQYRDVSQRFRLLVQRYRDIAARFQVLASNWKDAAVRFALTAFTTRDTAVRFKVDIPSVTVTHPSATQADIQTGDGRGNTVPRTQVERGDGTVTIETRG